MMCVCVCVFAVLDIVNILDLFLPVVITHTARSDMCVCVCVCAVLHIVNILDLFLPVVITHTAPSLGLFVPSHTSVLLRSSSV